MFLSWNLDGDTLISRSKCCGFLAAISQDQYYYFVLHGLIFISVSLQNACKSFAFPLISTPGTYLNSNLSLRKVPVFEDFLVCVFPHLDWIRRDTEYLPVFSPNAEKYGPEKLQIPTLFTQCLRCGLYWRAELKIRRHFVQSQRNYSLEISKLGNILFPYNSDNYYLIYNLIYCRTTRYFQFFIGCILIPNAF